jgi:hypothetical protein
VAPELAANVPGVQGMQSLPLDEALPAVHAASQVGGAHPSAQRQRPSACAVPWPLQVPASEYWQPGPVKPEAHWQPPLAVQLPWPPQVEAARQ